MGEALPIVALGTGARKPTTLLDYPIGRFGWVVGQLNQQPVLAGKPESLEDLEDQVDFGRGPGVGLTLSSRVAWCKPWVSGRGRQPQPTPIPCSSGQSGG